MVVSPCGVVEAELLFNSVRMFANMFGVIEFAAVCIRKFSMRDWICVLFIVLQFIDSFKHVRHDTLELSTKVFSEEIAEVQNGGVVFF